MTTIEWENKVERDKVSGEEFVYFTATAGDGDVEITASDGCMAMECGELYLEVNTDSVERSKAIAELFLPHALAMSRVKSSDVDRLTEELRSAGTAEVKS